MTYNGGSSEEDVSRGRLVSPSASLIRSVCACECVFVRPRSCAWAAAMDFFLIVAQALGSDVDEDENSILSTGGMCVISKTK